MVRAVTYNMTSETALEDLVQETFLKVWQGLPMFQFKSSVKTWVYRVAINTSVDYLRRKQKIAELKPALTATGEAPSEHLWGETRQNQEVIQWALQQIEPEARSILTLHYFEELKLEEIAEILQIPNGTVKSRLSTARQRLKDCLTKKGVVL